jgi:hypothetical protein
VYQCSAVGAWVFLEPAANLVGYATGAQRAWFKRVMSAGETHIEAAASQLDLKVERVGDKAIEEIESVHVAYRAKYSWPDHEN